ncbi:MAG: carboxymuconolactone decarboxylase family protein [Streptosporangiaceae bacterium]
MSATPATERAEAVRDSYRAVFGAVPSGIEDRIAVAEAAGRLDAVETIEALRRVLLADNPLGARTQQLVHFGQLVALGREGPARLHARGALRAGASITDLVGVAETSLVTAGMPAYSLAVTIVAELISDETRGDQTFSTPSGDRRRGPVQPRTPVREAQPGR